MNKIFILPPIYLAGIMDGFKWAHFLFQYVCIFVIFHFVHSFVRCAAFTIIQFPIDRMRIWCARFFFFLWIILKWSAASDAYPSRNEINNRNGAANTALRISFTRSNWVVQIRNEERKKSFNWAIFILLSAFLWH